MHVCSQSPDREQIVVNSFRDKKKELKSYGFVWGGICFSGLVSLIHASSHDWSRHRDVFKIRKRISVVRSVST